MTSTTTTHESKECWIASPMYLCDGRLCLWRHGGILTKQETKQKKKERPNDVAFPCWCALFVCRCWGHETGRRLVGFGASHTHFQKKKRKSAANEAGHAVRCFRDDYYPCSTPHHSVKIEKCKWSVSSRDEVRNTVQACLRCVRS